MVAGSTSTMSLKMGYFFLLMLVIVAVFMLAIVIPIIMTFDDNFGS